MAWQGKHDALTNNFTCP